MNISFFIARRYLFSKKNKNAINIISGISVAVIAVATAALVIMLSFLNGFDDLIRKNINAHVSDIEITIIKGKIFSINDVDIKKVRDLKGVEYSVEVLEENVLLKSEIKQIIAVIKGVSEDFNYVNRLDTCVTDGEFKVHTGKRKTAVFGLGVAYNLGISVILQEPVSVWIPDREKVNINNLESSFNRIHLIPVGIISSEAEYDTRYVICDIQHVRQLTKRDSSLVSSVELKIDDNYNVNDVKKQIEEILGNAYDVKNKYDQNSDVYKIVETEKTAVFFILLFVVLIASFSMIASLTMLIIEKIDDIKTLRSMGADIKTIKKIFLTEGRLIAFFASIIGLLIGFLICFAQQEFGFIRFPSEGNYIVSAYPIKIRLIDFLLTFISVNIIGFIITFYPVIVLKKKLF